MRTPLKRAKKLLAARCTFCPEADPAVLDAHRIVPGAAGGRYTAANTLVLCAACHRKVHAGSIAVVGRHYTSAGRYVVVARVGGREVVFREPVLGE